MRMSTRTRPLLAVLLCLAGGQLRAAPIADVEVRAAARTFLAYRYPAVPAGVAQPMAARGQARLAVEDVAPWQSAGRTVGHVVALAPSGFVLLRADDRLPPLKLYAERGEFHQLPPWFLEVLARELATELGVLVHVPAGSDLTADFEAQWDALRDATHGDASVLSGFEEMAGADYGPLLATTWYQDDPYNLYAPAAAGGPGGRAYAGCVAVTMAQILKHHEYPATVGMDYSYTDDEGACTGTHACSDATLAPYDWANMPAAISAGSSPAQKHAVAQLMYHCGVGVDMEFEADESGAYSTRVRDSLRYLFNCDTGEHLERADFSDLDWYAMLETDMAAGRPAYYSFENQFGSGHAVVCDGVRSNDQIHLNFGWGGTSDAWYDMNHVTTSGSTWTEHTAICEISPAGHRPQYEMAVSTRNPHHGVMIAVSPADTGGQGAGTAPFARTYADGTEVTLTAPGSVNGRVFLHWQIDDIGIHSNRVLVVDAVVRHGLAAVYDVTAPPANDDLENAFIINAASGTVHASSALATIESGEPDHADMGLGGPFNTVWWILTPSVPGWYRIDTRGSNFDTVMALYTGTSMGDLAEVASNDDGEVWPCSDIDAWLAVGVTYYVAVAGCYDFSFGDVTLNWNAMPLTLRYVAPGGGNLAPYESWQNAAQDIETALTGAAPGTAVFVTNATYTLSQPIVVNTPVYLRGTGATLPVVDGNGVGPCFDIRAPAVVDRFVITNGVAVKDPAEPDARGGGVRLVGTGVLLGCTVAGNTSSGQAGGVYCHHGGAVVGCTIRDNTAQWGGGVTLMHGGTVYGGLIARNSVTNDSVSAGGGVNCDNGGTLVDVVVSNNTSIHDGGGIELYGGGLVRGCTIVDNDAKIGGGLCIVWNKEDGGLVEDCYISRNEATEKGGGIRCYDGGVIRDCTFVTNRANEGGGIQAEVFARVERCTLVSNWVSYAGGGVQFQAADCTLSESVLQHNHANSFGGGFSCFYGGRVSNCLVTHNQAWKGGGLFLWKGGVLMNGTVSDNLATDTSEGGGGLWLEGDAYAANSVLYHNTGGPGPNYHNVDVQPNAYSNCCATPPLTVGTGHTSSAPQFVNRGIGNYQLLAGSDCIDTGTPADAPGTDLLGVARPLDGDNAGGAAPDMGAYEFIHEAADSDSDTLLDRWEIDGGLDPTQAGGDDGPGGDPDGDGMVNSDECTADTLPLDADSCLEVLGLTTAGGALRLDWKGGIAAAQYIDVHPDLTNGALPWTCVHTNLPDTPVTNQHLLPLPGGKTFYYRVRAAQ